MSNMIQAAREQVAALTQAAYEKAVEAGKLPAGAEVEVELLKSPELIPPAQG